MNISEIRMYIIMLLSTGLVLYNLYNAWFRYDATQDELQAWAKKLPKWYPFRNYYLNRSRKRLDKRSDRAISCVVAFVVLLIWILFIIETYYRPN